MGLGNLHDVLASELSRNNDLFHAAKQRHATLTEHEAAESVLDLLHDTTADASEKDQITGALIEEYRRSEHHPYWAAFLLCAYQPMLGALRANLKGRASNAKDRDQIVMSAFLETIRWSKAPASYLPVWLERRTRRFAKRGMIRLQRPARSEAEARSQLDAERKNATWNGAPLAPPADLPPSTDDEAMLLLTAVSDKFAASDLDLFVATKLHNENLHHYITRLHGDLGTDEHKRVYTNLKRRRSRILADLRTHFSAAPLSPN